MKFYEKEVVSLPAADSIGNVLKYNIYHCPNTKTYNFKRPLFVTFRKKGGVMEVLYKIEFIIILNPFNLDEIRALKTSNHPEDYKTRMIDYLNVADFSCSKENEEKRFYLLSNADSIDLENKPHPIRNNSCITYYTLKEILTKTIVKPESQQ